MIKTTSQFEEFDKYYINQLNETDNQIDYEEPKDEDIIEEKENNGIINFKETNNAKQLRLKESTTRRLHSLPKRYQTYTLDYKKQVIEEVNK